jgi:quercetin dioxygenase-like cupin family protein
MNEPHIAPWSSRLPTSESAIRRMLAEENLSAYVWSNGPYEIYAPHMHDYNKVIYVVRGSITFQLIELGTWHTLHPGDRLDLPAGTVHAAEVGADGVVCLEAHR